MGQDALFDFSVNAAEKSFNLMGRVHTGADKICQKLFEGILCGKVRIKIIGNSISIVHEGISYNFIEDPVNLCRMKILLKSRNHRIQLEAMENDNFAGFRMLVV